MRSSSGSRHIFTRSTAPAIDWLNANTTDRFAFVGVEIEVLRIGDSPPAPRFSLVAKPNDWSRSVGALSRAATSGELAERHKVRIGYWTSFAEFVKDRGARFRVRRGNKDMWHQFPIGRGGVGISATISTDKRRVGVELYFHRDDAKIGIRTLQIDRQTIEAEFGEPLDWQELPGKRASRIVVYRYDVDPSDVTTYPDLHAWMLDRMTRMRSVFADRVKRLDLSVEEAEMAEVDADDPGSTDP